MTDIEKIAAIISAEIPDGLKVELIRLLVGQSAQPRYWTPWWNPTPTTPCYLDRPVWTYGNVA